MENGTTVTNKNKKYLPIYFFPAIPGCLYPQFWSSLISYRHQSCQQLWLLGLTGFYLAGLFLPELSSEESFPRIGNKNLLPQGSECLAFVHLACHRLYRSFQRLSFIFGALDSFQQQSKLRPLIIFSILDTILKIHLPFYSAQQCYNTKTMMPKLNHAETKGKFYYVTLADGHVAMTCCSF